MRLPRTALGVFAVLLLVGCADDVPLPEAAPLSVDDAIIDTLYGAVRGPHTVSSVKDVALASDKDQRELSLNVYFPSEGQNFPLLLFSHGNWSDKDSYDRLIEYWVSHGYTVLATNHLDCCGAVSGIFNSLRYGQLGLIDGRLEDLNRLLNELPTLESQVPEFAGKGDPQRLAVTGHSFGAFSAQQFGGAGAFDPDAETYLVDLDDRVKAVVALSPPGPMFDTITSGSWEKLQTPTLVTTGTWDIQPSFWPDWRAHLMSWETALPGDKYALVIEGADHYLGNLICRTEREATPQHDALRMVQIASVAFLDAYLKGESAAQPILHGDTLATTTGGFARLRQR